MRGTIRPRGKGTYALAVYIGRNPKSGNPRHWHVTVHGTKKEAEAELARMIRAVETGTELDPARLTVSEYLEHWLQVRQPKIKPRTHERYAEVFRLHVTPVIGNVRLAKLKPLHLESVYQKARAKGLSEQTLLHIHRAVFTALRQAVKWQLAARNVAEAVEAPKPSRRYVAALESTDAIRVLEAVADSDLELPVILGLGTGMRLGEVLGLRWQDVDLEAAAASISQTLQIDMTFGTPKSHRSDRKVSLPVFVVEALKRHRKAQTERRLVCGAAWCDFDLVNDRGDGRPYDPRSVSRRVTATTKALGLQLTFHGLRHGFATLALASGTDLKVTQGLLGHSTIGITANYYTHVAEKVDHEAAARLQAHLFPQR